MTSMTPYAAAKIANAALAHEGFDKVLPPQMFYTYAKKDYIATVTVDDKVRITEEGLAAWLVTYINKLSGKTVEDTDSNIDEHQLALEI